MNASIYTTKDNQIAYQLDNKRALFNGKEWCYQVNKDGVWVDGQGWRKDGVVAKVKAALGK